MDINQQRVVCFDVDGTLVDNLGYSQQPPRWGVGMVDDRGRIYASPDALEKPNIVAKLIEHFEMGDRIIVWSWGGERWAAEVAFGLGISHMVEMTAYKGWWNLTPETRAHQGLPEVLPMPDVTYDDNDNHIGPPVPASQETIIVDADPRKWSAPASRFDDDDPLAKQQGKFKTGNRPLYGIDVDWFPYRKEA